ncbi:MAG TPA: NAD-binding protein, partial [Microbacterium sp.]|nr:NAD-binding protein [Microbacterium sp.]
MGSFLSFGENSHRIAEADSVVVIGLGRFGTAVAVDEFDRAVIAITGDLKASNLTASLLLQLNGPVIWAKATDAQHGRILEQLGVHHVVYPETDMGRRVAHLVRGAAKDYPEIDGGYALVEASA